MRKLFFFLFIFSVNCIADPFYTEELNKEASSNEAFAKNLSNPTACKPNNTVENRYLAGNFDDLKLVGIIQQQEKYTALFLNKENKLLDLHIGDFLVSAQIEIEHIDLKNVQIIDWKKSEICAEPKRIQLKL